jgi:hypothetical protein
MSVCQNKCQKIFPEENSFENCIEMKHSHGPIELFQYPVPLIFQCNERIPEVEMCVP